MTYLTATSYWSDCRSFEGTCSRLKTSFESLKQLFSEMGAIPVLEAVIQQALLGIKTIISVS